jgi:hypothetical protein
MLLSSSPRSIVHTLTQPCRLDSDKPLLPCSPFCGAKLPPQWNARVRPAKKRDEDFKSVYEILSLKLSVQIFSIASKGLYEIPLLEENFKLKHVVWLKYGPEDWRTRARKKAPSGKTLLKSELWGQKYGYGRWYDPTSETLFLVPITPIPEKIMVRLGKIQIYLLKDPYVKRWTGNQDEPEFE